MSDPQRFLDEVERGLTRRLPPQEIPVRLAEVADHLADTVEAYGEMGLSEVAAVRTMGCPRRLARELAHAALGAWDRRRIRFAAVAMAGFGANLAGLPPWPWLIQPLAVLSVGAVFGVAYTAFHARRPRPLTLSAIAFGMVVPMLFVTTVVWVNVPLSGGERGNSPRYLVKPFDLQAFEGAVSEPIMLQAARQVPRTLRSAAYLALTVGSVDVGFAALGLFAINVRRRFGVA